MDCNAIKLFTEHTCAASIIAVVAFILGVVATCIVCRLRCKCGAKKGACGSCDGQEKGSRRAPQRDAGRFEKTHPAPADGSIEIYVGNLSYDLTEDQLRKEFEAFGKVNSARIIMNRYNGKSKGFGFVHMPNRAEVDAALKALSDKEILGRKLKCNEAKNVG